VKTKNMDALYLVTNYLLKENQIRVRFGWLLKSDWPHSDSHGKSDVRRDVQNRNLVELHNENREYWKH
ncbi:MAG: hypothetical protein WA728_09215, partial [Xanthobacteraceae bacterium]